MKDIHMKKILIIFLVVLFFIIPPVFGHPGKTDSSGGHYDRSTGEYHYHHGYPAHQHIDGVCPYDNVNKTNTEKENINTYVTNENTSVLNTYTENNVSENEDVYFIEEHPFLSIILLYIAVYIALAFIYYVIETFKEYKAIKNKTISQNTNTQTIEPKYTCPKCGSPLRIRTGRYGKFLGCSRYPYCKYTRNLYNTTKDK